MRRWQSQEKEKEKKKSEKIPTFCLVMPVPPHLFEGRACTLYPAPKLSVATVKCLPYCQETRKKHASIPWDSGSMVASQRFQSPTRNIVPEVNFVALLQNFISELGNGAVV